MLSSRIFAVGGARLAVAPALGGSRLPIFTGLLLHPGGILCLGILHPRRFLPLTGVLASRAAGRAVFGTRLLLPLLSPFVSALGCNAFLIWLRHVARRLREIREFIAGQVFEQFADDRGGELQVQCQ